MVEHHRLMHWVLSPCTLQLADTGEQTFCMLLPTCTSEHEKPFGHACVVSHGVVHTESETLPGWSRQMPA